MSSPPHYNVMRSRRPTFAAPHYILMRSRRPDLTLPPPWLNPPLCFRHMVRFLGTRCSHPATLACGGGGTRPWVCSKLHFFVNFVFRSALHCNAEPHTCLCGSALESNAETLTWTPPGQDPQLPAHYLWIWWSSPHYIVMRSRTYHFTPSHYILMRR